MASLMVVHLTGDERGKTFIFDQEAITLGPDRECDIPLDIPPSPNGTGEAARHIVAEIYRKRNNFDLFFRDYDHYSLLINRKPYKQEDRLTPIPLSDGDLLSVQAVTTTELHMPSELLVHVVQELEETRTGVRNTRLQFPEVDRGGRIHPRTASRFAKELILALYAEIPPWARVIAVLLTIVIPLCILISTGVVFYGIFQYNTILNRYSKLSAGAEAQIDEQLRKIEALAKENQKLRESVYFGQSVAGKYSGGVCLIQGVYTYTNKQTNQPLRYIDRSFNQGMAIGPDGTLQVSFEGTGDIYYEEFTGTGFLIAEGSLLTNRHVVQPWWQDQNDQVIINSLGGKPLIKELYAFFPAFNHRFDLSVTKTSTDNDIALCSFDQGDYNLPELPLEDAKDSRDNTGQPIVLLGYPTGVDGIIEMQPDEKSKQDLRSRVRLSERAQELARRGAISPSATQGHITRFIAGRIVHDAATTDGGSGSPIFNIEGKVVGINAQIMVDESGRAIQGSNLGVPIRAAFELIKAAEEK
ncbi:MAG: serine protease [Blastocatellia bacterium]|nr:serine protease [Blastocatellia bacterium]